jgi:glycosyltransferase involved in cell wall biosynthesis
MREKIREAGWETVKSKSHKIMARRMNKLYYSLMGGGRWVSVIVPTYDRPDYLVKVLAGIENQTYQNIEIVVVDSGDLSVEPLVNAFRKESKRPIKYFRFDNKGEYTLAKARNIGIQKSLGEVLVFCDDRLIMESEAVAEFEKRAVPKAFLYGRKDGAMKGFVENFSCILRREMVDNGLFNERVDCYGGQTQATREKFEHNGFMFEAVDSAKANSVGGTHRMNRRNDIIKAKFILQEFYE